MLLKAVLGSLLIVGALSVEKVGTFLSSLKRYFASKSVTVVKDVKVIKIGAIPQQGVTCGYWALFNAAGVQYSIEQKGCIDQHLIQQYARQLQAQYLTQSTRMLDSEDIENLAATSNTAALILGYFNDNIISLNASYACKADEKVSGYDLFKRDIEQLKELVRSSHTQHTNLVLPFVCNIANVHWVTVCVVVEKEKDPYIVFMDSVNGSAHQATAYIDFIKKDILS